MKKTSYTSLLLALGALLILSSGQTQSKAAVVSTADESSLCLHDGRGDRTTASMQNCEVPGGELAGQPYVDGGYFLSMGDYTEFKASRKRVSEQYDVDWVAEKPTDIRGILIGASGGAGQYKTPTAYWGLRLNRMAGIPGPFETLPVVAHKTCRYLYNTSPNDLFVPFKTDKEWAAFLNNLPSGVTANTCAIFCPGTCNNLIVFGPTSKKSGDASLDKGSGNNWFRVELPYAPTGTTWPTAAGAAAGINRHTFNYRCEHVDVVPDSSNGYCTAWTTSTVSCTKGEPDCNCDKWGNCSKDITSCATPGSKCVRSTKDWSETWEIPVGNVLAGIANIDANGKVHASGWGPAKVEASGSVSKQVGGTTRPCTGDGFIEQNSGLGKICGPKKCVLLPGNPNRCGGGSSGGGGGGGPVGLGCF